MYVCCNQRVRLVELEQGGETVWKFGGKERQMAEEMKVGTQQIKKKEGGQSVKERWRGGD